MTTQTLPAPTLPAPGVPATIHLVTDTWAAVVTKVNPKSIVVARVATGPEAQDMSRDGAHAFPVMVAQGLTDQIVGTPERYSIVETDNGTYYRSRMGLTVTLGRSVEITDYRH